MATPTDIEKYRKQLENPAPISIRGGNRERAIALGCPRGGGGGFLESGKAVYYELQLLCWNRQI